MKRIYFLTKQDRNNFFYKIKTPQLSWNKISNILNTNRSMIESYRSGKLCIPEDRFFTLINMLSDGDKVYFKKKIGEKEQNWGQIIGGKEAYKINKKKFEEGRKKGGMFRVNILRYNFNINMNLSEELCEFLGAIIGDGFTNNYGNRYQTQITGDKKLDSEYYYNRLKPISEKIFSITPKIIIDERYGWVRFNIYSKRLFEMLTIRFKIPKGVKSYTVVIPKEIINSDEKFINATLRGMFDTDGGIGIDKRKSYKKPYIRINYTSASEELIKQIDKILLNYVIPHSIHKKGTTFMIQINGEVNVKKFISKIGFSNPRHLGKISYLLK